MLSQGIDMVMIRVTGHRCTDKLLESASELKAKDLGMMN